ncbi:hypothetical protein FIV42_11325 [Persicimonas caeni]|uniref:Chemotaxis phosphatase CheX-like domain-containing protein n=1 Tax=Persicimonas caeni TaxID=2292766 RepID=A0A4Y6PST9_PERCE|nr:hypothetical protein [Persicimonas caeni]QDG51310.1 hypothetical protein FIV42_11325 [Persicimonas caeni]QED32531.1 hypothetical protein FRD00_11320 [Persicimonas caeni]
MDASTIDQAGPKLAELVGSLLGCEVVAEPSTQNSGTRPHAVAIYVTEEGTLRAALVCDSAIVNYAGAALTMMPAGTAQENQKKGIVPEMMFENLHEILNICSQLFQENYTSSVKLHEMYDTSTKAPPQPIPMFLQKAPGRLSLTVDIEDYGSGEMMVIMS